MPEQLMVIPGVGLVTRHCHGVTLKGVPCMSLGPWDWTPVDGPWYCHNHMGQIPNDRREKDLQTATQ